MDGHKRDYGRVKVPGPATPIIPDRPTLDRPAVVFGRCYCGRAAVLQVGLAGGTPPILAYCLKHAGAGIDRIAWWMGGGR